MYAHFSEARLLSSVPENCGTIMDQVIRKKLYKCATEIMVPIEQILRFNLKNIGYQLLEEKTKLGTENEEIESDNGPFNNLPREIIFNIFSYLNLYSLGKLKFNSFIISINLYLCNILILVWVLIFRK